ncbi:MAG: NINE protein [Phycisphaeraceae bacterium]
MSSTHPTYHPDATNDPLVGTQEHPDQRAEQRRDPDREAAAWPTHGAPVKSRLLAGIYALLLGWLGVHRFYLGFVTIGLFQLSLSAASIVIVVALGLATGSQLITALISAMSVVALIWIWGAIEGMMILGGMMQHDGQARPLR